MSAKIETDIKIISISYLPFHMVCKSTLLVYWHLQLILAETSFDKIEFPFQTMAV